MARRTEEEKAKIAEAIIEAVSNGTPLVHACRDNKLGVHTWYDWVEKNEALAARIARARKAGHDVIATDTLRIADEQPPVTATGATDAGFVSWQKNRVWARMQLLAKWDPKRYGDKLELSGDSDRPIAIQQIERVIVKK
jgi:metal-dependent amidase/aminoacylase/carboxypeptidase family protein